MIALGSWVPSKIHSRSAQELAAALSALSSLDHYNASAKPTVYLAAYTARDTFRISVTFSFRGCLQNGADDCDVTELLYPHTLLQSLSRVFIGPFLRWNAACADIHSLSLQKQDCTGTVLEEEHNQNLHYLGKQHSDRSVTL